MIIKYTLYFYGFGYISNVLEPGQSLTFRIRIGLPTLSGYLERILSIYSCEIQRYTDTDVSYFFENVFVDIFLRIYFGQNISALVLYLWADNIVSKQIFCAVTYFCTFLYSFWSMGSCNFIEELKMQIHGKYIVVVVTRTRLTLIVNQSAEASFCDYDRDFLLNCVEFLMKCKFAMPVLYRHSVFVCMPPITYRLNLHLYIIVVCLCDSPQSSVKILIEDSKIESDNCIVLFWKCLKCKNCASILYYKKCQ